MKTIALISARGLSGGLARKNVHPVLGRPMIRYSLDALRESRIVERTYVFTEDAEISALAREAGARVIPRTMEQVFYNGGYAPLSSWREHVQEFIGRDAGPWESLVTFDVNCNFCLLSGETLARMFYTLMENETATEIVGVTRVEPHLFTVNPNTGQLFPIWHEPGLDRQKYPPLYRFVGGAVVTHQLRAARSHIPKRIYHEMTSWEALDVQSPEDVDMAEYFLARRGRRAATPGKTGAETVVEAATA